MVNALFCWRDLGSTCSSNSKQRKAQKLAVANARRRLGFETLEDRRMLALISVSNLNGTGSGSLRDAIIQANGNGEADTINFSVTGTINIGSELPPPDKPRILGATLRK